MGLTVAPRNFKSCFLLVEKHAQRSLSSTVTVQGGGQGCNHLRDSLLSVGWVENSRLGIWFIFSFVFCCDPYLDKNINLFKFFLPPKLFHLV